MIRVLEIIASFSVGTLAGTELAVSLFVNPVLWRLEERSQASGIRGFAERFGGVMPYWYGFDLLLLIAVAIVRREGPDQYLLYAAIALWALTILLTILFLVPINNRLASRTTDDSFDAMVRQHRLWDTRHRVRILAVASAFVCLLFAVIH